MTTISIRLDDKVKAELDEICEEIGMNLTTLFTVYAKKVARDREIPFRLSAPEDPFYSESNMKALAESEKQFREGKVVIKTMEELEAMARE